MLARHLRSSSETQPTAVQQGLCEAQPDDGKVITAEQAAALDPGQRRIITVSRPEPRYTPQSAVTPSSACGPPWTHLLDCCRCLDSSDQV